jgi:uncharacterized Fe-S cluster protein YjdI
VRHGEALLGKLSILADGSRSGSRITAFVEELQVPESKVHRYDSADGVVTWDAVRCIHAAECVRGLPQVFDPKAKPWIAPEKSDADTIAAVIARCPSGALHLERRDGGAAEAPDPQNTATVTRTVRITCAAISRSSPTTARCLHRNADRALPLRRIAEQAALRRHASQERLCRRRQVAGGRCGAGRCQCLGTSHRPGDRQRSDQMRRTPHHARHGRRQRFRRRDGPVPCGHSANKPYCDGTHKRIGFKS